MSAKLFTQNTDCLELKRKNAEQKPFQKKNLAVINIIIMWWTSEMI